MEVVSITVSAGRTFNHPYEQYSNLRPNVTITANLAAGEDPEKAVRELQAMAEKSVEDHKQGLLQSLEDLHDLTERQREMTTLAEQLTRAQRRLDEIRKQHPNMTLPGIAAGNEAAENQAQPQEQHCEVCGARPEEPHMLGCSMDPQG